MQQSTHLSASSASSSSPQKNNWGLIKEEPCKKTARGEIHHSSFITLCDGNKAVNIDSPIDSATPTQRSPAPQPPSTRKAEDRNITVKRDDERANGTRRTMVVVDDGSSNIRKTQYATRKRKAPPSSCVVEDEVEEEEGNGSTGDGNTAKKKIKIDYIQEVRSRQVTFLKRKNGVMKKAMELSILCDCEVSVIIHNKDTSKMFEYGSHDIVQTLGRYARYGSPDETTTTNQHILMTKEGGNVVQTGVQTSDSGQTSLSPPNSAERVASKPALTPSFAERLRESTARHGTSPAFKKSSHPPSR